VYRRRQSVLDFTSTGEVSLSFTCFKVAEWLSKRLYTTIGGILVVLSGGFGGASVSSMSERTANWLGDKKEGEAPLEVGSWPHFRFGHWAS
jgi:hypothetical protein